MPACKGCGADMIFATTDRGAKMPLDAKETKIAVIRKNDAGEHMVERLVVGHVPHHLTCPNADDFRRKKTNENQNHRLGRSRPAGYDRLV